VGGDDEKKARERERDTRDDCSGGAKPELRHLRRGEPDPREQDEQESDFRKADARVVRQSDDVHGWHSSCAATPVSRQGRPDPPIWADDSSAITSLGAQIKSLGASASTGSADVSALDGCG
jgi:hypothetical protein